MLLVTYVFLGTTISRDIDWCVCMSLSGDLVRKNAHNNINARKGGILELFNHPNTFLDDLSSRYYPAIIKGKYEFNMQPLLLFFFDPTLNSPSCWKYACRVYHVVP